MDELKPLDGVISDAITAHAATEATQVANTSAHALTSTHFAQDIEAAVASRAAGQEVYVHTGPDVPTPSAPASPLGAVEAEEESDLLAERERLASMLAEAQVAAESSMRALASAEAAWTRTEKHTRTDAELLQVLRDEAPAAQERADETQHRLDAVHARLATMSGATEERRRRDLAEALWPPMVAKLAGLTRQMIAALGEQERVRDRLYDEHAWVFARCEDLVIGDARFSDLLRPRLAAWLAQAEQAYRV
jgi:hypothetical protein